MFRNTVIALVAVFASSILPAAATESISCQLARETVSENLRPGHMKACVEEQAKSIKEKDGAISRLKKALGLAWTIAANPYEFVRLAPLEKFRSDERIGARAWDVHSSLERMLRPDAHCYEEDCFKELRARFADPVALAGFWEANGTFIVAAVKAAAIIGSAGDFFNENAVLIEKPFDVALAASAGRWYGAQCWKSPDQLHERNVKFCKELGWFSDRFKTVYEVDLTPNRAWSLAFLYRRYSEGGPQLVNEYIRIGKDLRAWLGVEPKP